MKSIYEYTDYRRFLRHRFAELKEKNPLFSFRSFNRLAGLKSSAALKLVMDGKRNLARNGIRRVAKGFKLSEPEFRYFKTLILFNQAKDHEDKEKHFREICDFRKFLTAKPLTLAQYNLLSRWYYVAILELVRIETPGKKDVAWIQARLHPEVGLREVKKAVQEMKEINLLAEDAGGFRRQDAMLATDDAVRSLSAINFHVQMCEMAARAVTKERAKDREFSALTIVASDETFKRIKKEIQDFRKKLHSLLEQETSGRRNIVSQINLQLFKLSKNKDAS
jgi:uncharacterized protein (TIGR02147 family)